MSLSLQASEDLLVRGVKSSVSAALLQSATNATGFKEEETSPQLTTADIWHTVTSAASTVDYVGKRRIWAFSRRERRESSPG